MKQIKLKIIIFISLIVLLQNCSGVKEAFEGQKRSEQSDEFLVKKKNPLQMPPDMNKLPTPGEELEVINLEKKDEIKELLQIKDSKGEDSSDTTSDLLKNMKDNMDQHLYNGHLLNLGNNYGNSIL